MNYEGILKELGRSGLLTPERAVMVRSMKSEAKMWNYLFSLNAPDTVHAAAETPIFTSTETLDRNRVQELVNEHLTALGFPPTPIKLVEAGDIDNWNVENAWMNAIGPDRGEAYSLGVKLGHHPRVAAIIVQEGAAWIPLHHLISCGYEPMGLAWKRISDTEVDHKFIYQEFNAAR